MTQINRGFFFTHVRRVMFSNILQQSQVDGMNAILDGWEAKYTADDDRWLAYALATTYHETDQHMQPIDEYGKGRGRPYGKADPRTGQVYYGRGFVQLTWERNYETMSNLLGIDFVHHPDLALELDNATKHHVPRHGQGFVHGQVAQRLLLQNERRLGERPQDHQRRR
jgi:hypothetical protein